MPCFSAFASRTHRSSVCTPYTSGHIDIHLQPPRRPALAIRREASLDRARRYDSSGTLNPSLFGRMPDPRPCAADQSRLYGTPSLERESGWRMPFAACPAIDVGIVLRERLFCAKTHARTSPSRPVRSSPPSGSRCASASHVAAANRRCAARGWTGWTGPRPVAIVNRLCTHGMRWGRRPIRAGLGRCVVRGIVPCPHRYCESAEYCARASSARPHASHFSAARRASLQTTQLSAAAAR